MQHASDMLDLAPSEREVLGELLQVHPGRPFQFYIDRLKKIFANPSPQLYIAVGYAIGHLAGAEYTRFLTIQNLTKCREN